MALLDTNTPLVSIIVPSYNYGHFLWQTIACLQMQTCTDWECIVVDDGSTDSTREVIEQFETEDPRIRYIYQSNAGPSAARNTGLRESRGQFIQLLDSDDMIEPRKLESQVAFLNTHPEVDVVCGTMRFVSIQSCESSTYNTQQDTRLCLFNNQIFGVAHGAMVFLSYKNKTVDIKVNDSVPPVYFVEENLLTALIRSNNIIINVALVRKKVFDDTGNFDEALLSVEDWHFWVRCALLRKKFATHHEPLTCALVRWHGQSLSKNKIRMIRASIQMREILEPMLTGTELQKINHKSLVQNYASLGMQEGLEGQFWSGAKHLWKSGCIGKKFNWLVFGAAAALRDTKLFAPLLRYLEARFSHRR